MRNVLFVYRSNLLEKKLRSNGIARPADFLWGMNELDPRRFSIRYVNAPNREKRKGVRRLTWFLEFPFARLVRIGLPIELYPLFKKQLQEADEIICVNDPISLGLLFWRLIGRLKGKRMHCVVFSLSERIKYFCWNQPLVWFVSKMLGQADQIATLSHSARQGLIANYHLQPQRVTVFTFGIDTTFWKPLPDIPKECFVLSVGNDINRDYLTLVNALPPRLNLKIVTQKKVATLGKNVEVISGITNELLRELYNRALIVVIPSIRLKNESSGLSSTLQAMACRTSVIVSDTPSFREIFVDGSDCLFYRAEDPQHLRECILSLVSDSSQEKRDLLAHHAYQKVTVRYTCKHMGKQWESLLNHGNL